MTAFVILSDLVKARPTNL